MSEKTELASYLCNLITIMESQEDAALARSTALAQEYNRGYTRLKEIIGDETRDRQDKVNSRDTSSGQSNLPLSSSRDGGARDDQTRAPADRKSVSHSPKVDLIQPQNR